jgi:hypothetical protein
MARYRYHGSHPFMSKARQAAVDRERRFLANNRRVPYLFGHTDDVAVYLRKRARDRMHTIAREQAYMRTAQFGQFKLNKYQRSKTRYPKYFQRKSMLRIKTTPVYTGRGSGASAQSKRAFYTAQRKRVRRL